MIEKVEIITNMQPQTELEKSILRVFNGVATKLNEVIDAVNALVYEHDKDSDWYDDPKHREPADPYAESRRWIGCVCRFWYDNPNDTLLDYLDKIQTGKNGVEYYAKESGDWFPHCEPVKPEDDIIYKGE